MAVKELFKSQVKVVNIGLESFKNALDEAGAPAVQVQWKPPADVSPQAMRVIAAKKAQIEKANKKAMDIILRGMPRVIGLARAIDVIPGMKKNLFLHSGPPITWARMCGPMRGAMMGGLIYEGMAKTPAEAEKYAKSGKLKFAPCHEHCAVGPMAGVVTPSMPVWIVENKTFGNKAYCTLNEGLGKVLRYGAYGPDVIERLRWMENVLYPVLQRAVKQLGFIDLKNLIAQALHMGDEVHNRNRAGTSLLYRLLAPAIIKSTANASDAAAVLEFIHSNDHFFLNLSMPVCKCVLDAARGIKNSSVCTVMARNGTDFGVQISATGGKWYVGEALVPDALYFPGFSKADAARDIGDSAITETGGLGGFAIAASPAIVQFVGGVSSDALRYTSTMYEITAAENNVYQIPSMNFRGTPTGIDVVKVVEKNILPFIDTGVAHKEPGVGQVGAGVLNAPMDPFKKAYEGLAKHLASSRS
ncbi:MAG TPA: DUF1116 domain-containing protein [Kiritimatiellia bacterium]|nr:DUF1116 domain-containing protein [Kiritimatiellia bacterium]HQQ03595.1 DUF1116 domain-containing protein [Kiritimatiellia bacterium]